MAQGCNLGETPIAHLPIPKRCGPKIPVSYDIPLLGCEDGTCNVPAKNCTQRLSRNLIVLSLPPIVVVVAAHRPERGTHYATLIRRKRR